MTEEPASGPPPPTSTDPPRRPWTILGRLARAVREQNWFAVALEIVIVVLGVVIGFQVTAWGQRQADRAKEQAYLRQVAADLAETERSVAEAHEVNRPFALATHALHRAFYTPERPPRDSVLVWAGLGAFYEEARPVLGTLEALVATGDLSLVRSDSLRSAMITYLEGARSNLASQSRYVDVRQQADLDLWTRLDFVEPVRATLSPDEIEAVMGVPLDRTAYFGGPRRSPRPLDVERFLADDAAREAVERRVLGTQVTWRERLEMIERAAALRQRVEAHIEP